MPLLRGSSPAVIRANIARMIREGRSPAQASAIAYRVARAHRRNPLGINPLLLLALGGAAVLYLLSRTQQGQDVTARIIDTALTPRGIRNNNPGNIVRTSDAWKGMSADQSGDDHFVVFDAPVWGLRAMARVLRKYIASGADTVQEIIARWAPSNENDTDAYVAAVSQSMGVSPSDTVTDALLPSLMAAITKHENGTQPYAVAMFDQAIALERSA